MYLYNKNILIECNNNKKYVYKKCRNNLIVILKKLTNTITNESIDNLLLNKYRANILKVKYIFNIDNLILYNSAISVYDINFVYHIGEIVKVNNYDYDLKNICGPGIYYFTTLKLAYHYSLLKSSGFMNVILNTISMEERKIKLVNI